MLNRRQSITAIFAGALAATAVGQTQTQTPVRKPVVPQKPKNDFTTIYIKNMHCEGCAKRLRTRLYKLPGVLKVTTYVKQGMAVVVPAKKKPVKTEQLWDATIAEKFVIMKVKTPKGVYLKRPGTPVKAAKRPQASKSTR